MSVTNTPRKAGPYTGNNTDVQYTFGFKVFADSDLVVTRAVIATGAESTLVLTTDYSVTRNADQDVDPGGHITLTAALADTYTLTLTSAVPVTQPAVFTNLGGFYPAVLNNALDRLTVLCQQLAEQVGRSLKVPISSAATATSDYLMGLLNAAVADASGSATAASGSATAASGSATAASGSATAANNSAIAAAASMSAALPKAGGTMSGAIVLAGDAVNGLEAVPLQQLTAATGNLAGAPFYNATASVPVSDAGKLITVYGNTGSVTLTLPTPVGNAGKCFRFYNNSAYTATLATPAGVFTGSGAAVIQALCQSTVVSDGTNWVFVGGGWAGNNSQSWANVTGSRAAGTTYYNTTGMPRQVFVESAASSTGVITVGGVAMEFVQGSGSPRASIAVIVPPGVGYSVTNSFNAWYELG